MKNINSKNVKATTTVKDLQVYCPASVQIRMPFRLLQATGEFWRLRRGASVTLDESQSKCSRKDALMRRLLLLVAGSTLASRLRASSKCATSSPPELKGAPVPTPTPFVPTTAAATAVDLPLGGLDLPTNTRCLDGCMMHPSFLPPSYMSVHCFSEFTLLKKGIINVFLYTFSSMQLF
ncbi:uncharacterized protein LOC100502485 [Zea mays]|uniref:Uncharacterized protein n=1 Tax=Zea mays TaxID=4577 RepID=C4JBY1_MAIZE|nr:uncharacterized protein LOC100502485 [Zea mays]ACR38681.1 unknown [Zea mays]|eukprot:NP_001183892.1 uncharacterized protein LOC100502485 [Zea mays]